MRNLIARVALTLMVVGCGGVATETPSPSLAPSSASSETSAPTVAPPAGAAVRPSAAARTCQPTDQGAFVYHREGGAWKVVHHHTVDRLGAVFPENAVVAQLATQLQDPILELRAGPPDVVRCRRAPGPVHTIQALVSGSSKPELDGREADSEPAGD